MANDELAVSAFGLIMGRRNLSGSPIGGIAETQEMLDFCGQHNITADVEARMEIRVQWRRVLMLGTHERRRQACQRFIGEGQPSKSRQSRKPGLFDKTTAPPWPRESPRYSARSGAE